jgi:hypothetical protein
VSSVTNAVGNGSCNGVTSTVQASLSPAFDEQAGNGPFGLDLYPGWVVVAEVAALALA